MKKNNSQKISVVIVTKNRAKDVLECISSLLTQTEPITELLIIDNNSTDSTPQIIRNLQKHSTISIRFILEKKIGYPIVYNRGLAEVSSKWVAFIDDDCVAGQDWFKNIQQAVNAHSTAAAIVGKSDTYHTQNVFSLAISFFDQMWKENGKVREQITHFATLDNKNIVYNKEFLIKNNLKFDERRLSINNGAAEDVDLGLRIQQHNGQAYYDPAILVTHKDPVSFHHYFAKLKSASQAARSVSNYIPMETYERRYRVRNWFQFFCNSYNLNLFLQVKLFFVIFITILGSKRFSNL